MSTSAGNDNGYKMPPDTCANCGKEGDNINNICNKCKQVKYCNAACKKKHRHKHKKECDEHQRLAAKRAAELHDEKLFKQPPPEEDCPICFVRLPLHQKGSKYMACCGKKICSGCIHAPVYDNQGNIVAEEKCPFCRSPKPQSMEESVEREKKRADANDAAAMFNQGNYYFKGLNGYSQDVDKALELWHRSGELGCARAYCNIGLFYYYGEGVEIDLKKAVHYYELAAIGGGITARYNLGYVEEVIAGNMDRALKHYMIAIGGGFAESLEMIKQMYSNGHATKEDYTKALRAYQEYLGEIKSEQRDEAAAFSEKYRYYQ